MLIVGNAIVSDEVKQEKFCCNIGVCKGMCCVEGDFGAPITPNEKRIIKNLLNIVMPYIDEKAQQTINKYNFFTKDSDNCLVTQLVEGKECVFAIKNQDNCTLCVFEYLYNQNKINFIKPISCHLYPIRITQYDEMSVLNIHHWDVCKYAYKEGEKKNIYAYQICKQALIRRFSKDWYEQLLQAINEDKDL